MALLHGRNTVTEQDYALVTCGYRLDSSGNACLHSRTGRGAARSTASKFTEDLQLLGLLDDNRQLSERAERLIREAGLSVHELSPR